MSNIAPIAPAEVGVLASLASDYGMDRVRFVETLKATVMGGKPVSNEQLAAFCLVAKSHGLNPFTKEIFAFPSNGGIVPVVSVDGWLKLINSHPQFDGMEFRDAHDDKGDLLSVTCKVFRKDRSHATEVTEYMSECARGTDTWKKWPARMLRHKATIQAARYTFGFAGIYEPDEAERIHEAESARAMPDRIKPTDGVWESMDEETQQWLMKVAAEVIARVSKSPADANAYIASQQLATDEEAALWTLLESKVRTALKKAKALPPAIEGEVTDVAQE